MIGADRPTHHDVLSALRTNAGGPHDRAFGGVLQEFASACESARVVRIGEGLIRHAELALPDEIGLEEPTFVEWRGLSQLLFRANSDVPCAALLEPIADGYFAGAISVRFVAAPSGQLLPFVGRAIVDLRPPGATLSRVDRLRIQTGCPAAFDAPRAILNSIDRAFTMIDGYAVRIGSQAGARPTYPTGTYRERVWRTFEGLELGRALASTCVESDRDNPMIQSDRPDDVRKLANWSTGFLVSYGPRAALHLLKLFHVRSRLN